jgi:hypothetical protein
VVVVEQLPKPRVEVTLSPYGYVAGSPLDGTDPSGLCESCDAADLQAILDKLYQADDKIPGGTAGAIRHTAETGQLVGGSNHEQAGVDRLVALARCAQSTLLSVEGRAIAAHEAELLREALKELYKSPYWKRLNRVPSPGIALVVHVPSPSSAEKIGAALGLSGAAAYIVGGLITAAPAAA